MTAFAWRRFGGRADPMLEGTAAGAAAVISRRVDDGTFTAELTILATESVKVVAHSPRFATEAAARAWCEARLVQAYRHRLAGEPVAAGFLDAQ